LKIQLKRSEQLDGGLAKEPTAGQMEWGELAVNYNSGDPAIFIKDNDGNIIRIAGVGNIADDGQVEVPAEINPPATPQPGNLWFNPVDGRLYVYYEDDNSSQWVDASPDSWNPSVIPDPGGGDNQPGTLDDRYVKQVGDNMTGDLTLGNDKITLNADDGSGMFADTVEAPSFYGNDTGLSQVWYGGETGTSIILADGSATFAGTINAAAGIFNNGKAKVFVSSGDGGLYVYDAADTGTPTAIINKDGSATFAGDITAGDTTFASEVVQVRASGQVIVRNDGTAPAVWQVYNGGTDAANITSQIDYDGSATFAGNASFGGENIGWSNDTGTNIYPSQGIAVVTDTGSQGISIYQKGIATEGVNLAADGSATFAGAIQVSDSLHDATSYFLSGSDDKATLVVRNYSDGPSFQSGAKANNAAIEVFNNSASDSTSISMKGDGSATFAGSITTGTYDANSDSTTGSRVGVGAIRAQRPAAQVSPSGQATYSSYLGTVPKFQVFADGSATFAGNIQSGNATFTGVGSVLQNNGKLYLESFDGDNSTAFQITNPSEYSSPTVNINHNGSATFAGDVQVGGDPSDSGGSESGVLLLKDGSASFAGTVTATVVPPSDARFKENITPAKPQLADVVALGGLLKNYDWNDQAPVNDEFVLNVSLVL
jgi:hypothetical protein